MVDGSTLNKLKSVSGLSLLTKQTGFLPLCCKVEFLLLRLLTLFEIRLIHS